MITLESLEYELLYIESAIKVRKKGEEQYYDKVF